ncbi:hypothetical protein FKM82_000122 [Ascaphus truei]
MNGVAAIQVMPLNQLTRTLIKSCLQTEENYTLNKMSSISICSAERKQCHLSLFLFNEGVCFSKFTIHWEKKQHALFSKIQFLFTKFPRYFPMSHQKHLNKN